jgi:predicted enzyme related to lactoylglutathione lyase
MGKQAAWASFTKLVVVDLEGMAAFYKRVCGLEELARVNSDVGGRPISEIMFRRADQGGMMFVLFKYLDQQAPGADEVIVGVTTEDVAAFVDRAVAAGGSLAAPVKAMPEHGVKVAFVKDPEGHVLEVIEYLAGAGPVG